MKKSEKKTEFKQIRKFVKNDENVALAKAVQSLNVPASELETAHTETTFVFRVKNSAANGENLPAEKDYPFGLFSVEKTQEENDLQNATKQAMQHFGTFEANVKRVSEKEDETHFVFTKVRG